MGFRINTNIAAMAAHNNATINNRNMDTSLSRLSSGLRITKAADDASGMVIADSLRSQASSLGQAINNGNDAIGLIQTADGALDEYSKILDTIKTKTVQAASDGQNTASRQAIQKDINRLMETLSAISKTTAFNGQALLSGSFTNKEFQVGANANESIKASIGSTDTAKVGHTTRSDISLGSDQGGNIQLTVKSNLTGDTVTMKAIDVQSNNDPKNGMGALADEINQHTGTTGIRATAVVETVSSVGISAGSTSADFAINGVTIGAIVVEDNDNSGTLLAAINSKTTETGIAATLSTDGKLELGSVDGRAISVSGGVSAVIGSSANAMSTLGHIEIVQSGASEFQITGIGTGAVTNKFTTTASTTTSTESILAAGSTYDDTSILKAGTVVGGNVIADVAVTTLIDGDLKTGSLIKAASILKAGTETGASITVDADTTLTQDSYVTSGSTLAATSILGKGSIIQQDFTDNSISFTAGQVLSADYALVADLTLTADMTNKFVSGATGGMIAATSVLQAGSTLGADTTLTSDTTTSQDMVVETGSTLAAKSRFQAGSIVGADVAVDGNTTTFMSSTVAAGSTLFTGTIVAAGSTIGGPMTTAIAAGSFTEDMMIKAGSTLDSLTKFAAGTQINQDMLIDSVNYKKGDILEQDRVLGTDTILAFDMVMKGSTTALLGTASILATNTENAGTVGISNTEFQALSDIDVTTLDGAMKAMDTLDSAIRDLDSIRSDLGSVQNQFVSTINNISVTQVNLKAAESQIRDVDFAAESAQFSKLNILAQSGSYALSQANAVQQNVLRLLQ